MANQFTIYTSEDRDGPGPITGQTGSLVSVLNACLINGYGSSSWQRPAAGWIKPCPDSGSGVGLYPNCYAGFQQASGSKFSVFINDNYPVTSTYGEAWITGWQYLSSSFPTGSSVGHTGIGNGQFPPQAQTSAATTLGAVNCRKSALNTNVARSWILAADERTFYLWIATGDTAGVYYSIEFGDFYSLAGNNDKWCCLLNGRYGGSGVGQSLLDCVSSGTMRTGYSYTLNGHQVGLYGHFVANSAAGTGGCIWAAKKGDVSALNAAGAITTNYGYLTMDGIISYPNPIDNSIRLSPLWVVEPSAPAIRGKYRGLYHSCHPTSNVTTGQTFSGSGNFAGKAFMIIKQGPSAGHWVLEISPTLVTSSL